MVDENGEPVIGAQVKVKGTPTGTVTNVDGEFSLPATIKRGAEIVINYLGMETQTVKAAPGMKIAFALRIANSMRSSSWHTANRRSLPLRVRLV